MDCERYPDIEETTEEDLYSLIEYIDKLTITEGVRLISKRGPARKENSEGGTGMSPNVAIYGMITGYIFCMACRSIPNPNRVR
jgi:hypothetical protein